MADTTVLAEYYPHKQPAGGEGQLEGEGSLKNCKDTRGRFRGGGFFFLLIECL